MNTQQQYLVKKDDPTKYVFARTDVLAARPDMLPCDIKGNPLLFHGEDAGGLPRVALNTAVNNLMNALGISEAEAIAAISGQAAEPPSPESAEFQKAESTVGLTGRGTVVETFPGPLSETTDFVGSLKSKKDVAAFAHEKFEGRAFYTPFPETLTNVRRPDMEEMIRKWQEMANLEDQAATGAATEPDPGDKTGYAKE